MRWHEVEEADEGEPGCYAKSVQNRLLRAACALDTHASFTSQHLLPPARGADLHHDRSHQAMPTADLCLKIAALRAHEEALFGEVKHLRRYPSMASTLKGREAELNLVKLERDLLADKLKGDMEARSSAVSRHALTALQLADDIERRERARKPGVKPPPTPPVIATLGREPFLKHLHGEAALHGSVDLFPHAQLAGHRRPLDEGDEEGASQGAAQGEDGAGAGGEEVPAPWVGEDALERQLRAARGAFRAMVAEVSLTEWDGLSYAMGRQLDGYPRFHHQVLPLISTSGDKNGEQGNVPHLSTPATLLCQGSTCVGLFACGGENPLVIHRVPDYDDTHVSNVANDILYQAHLHQANALPAFLAKRFCLRPSEADLKRSRSMLRASSCNPLPPGGGGAYDKLVADTRAMPIGGQGGGRALLPWDVTGSTWRCEAPGTVPRVEDCLNAIAACEDPGAVTLLQRFVPSPGKVAEVLRVALRQGHDWGDPEESYGMWVIRNRCGYFDAAAREWDAARRIAIHLEEEGAWRRCEIHRVTRKTPRASRKELGLEERVVHRRGSALDAAGRRGSAFGGAGVPGGRRKAKPKHGFLTDKGKVNWEMVSLACEKVTITHKYLQKRVTEDMRSQQGLLAARGRRGADEEDAPRIMLKGLCADFVADEAGTLQLLKVRDCLWQWGVEERGALKVGH